MEMRRIEPETVTARSLLPALGDADQVVRDFRILDLPASSTVLGRGGEPVALGGVGTRNGCSNPGIARGMSRMTRSSRAWAASTSARRVALSPKFLSTCSIILSVDSRWAGIYRLDSRRFA